jgi:NTE family protein
MKKRKKLGLALGSGAVRGLAHIGVIRTLLRNNIQIDYIAGSSIGSWVGAHYALFQDLPALEEFTVQRKKEKLLSFLEPTFSGGLIVGAKFEKLIQDWLGDAKFSDTKIPFRAVATDLVKGEPVVFNSGPLAPALRASMAVPGVFTPTKMGAMVLVDGGVSNPVPDDVARKMGADVVLAVSLDSFRSSNRFAAGSLPLGLIAKRSMEVMRRQLARFSTHSADIVIEPDVDHYNSVKDYFMKDTGGKIVELGERAMELMMPQLKKKLAA